MYLYIEKLNEMKKTTSKVDDEDDDDDGDNLKQS